VTAAPVEVVRRMDETFRREGAEGLIEHFDELFAPDHEWRPAMTGSFGDQAYVGLDGFRAWWDNLTESFERLEVETEGLVPVGRDGVLLIGRLRARGRESGVELERETAQLLRVRDGRMYWAQSFLTHAEAFEAAAEMARAGVSTNA
jgi:ketosteroid isomerase-like protein